MEIAELQFEILRVDNKSISYAHVKQCIQTTANEMSISEEEVVQLLLEFYANKKSSLDSHSFLIKCMDYLKHEVYIPSGCVNNLKNVNLEWREIDVEGKKVYRYSIYNMSSGGEDVYENLTPELQLLFAGVTTVPIIPLDELKKFQRLFDDTLENFPEYRRSKKDPTKDAEGNPIAYVAGGFAALGNPGSFHNPLSRKLRKMGYDAMKKLMKQYITHRTFRLEDQKDVTEKPQKLQALSDRMMFRQKGQQPVAEAWHRDVMPPEKIEYNDEIFGGWINLDSTDQHFSCIPGSHANIIQKKIDHGFATLSDAINKLAKSMDVKYTDAQIKEKMKQMTKDRYKFRVPPGHMIVFPQYIMHEVVADKATHDMRRQFTGWRLTTDDKPLYPMKMFDDQAVIPLPGGMIPPMYAANHIMFYQKKPFNLTPHTKYTLSEWSKATFKKECLVENKNGSIFVERHMKSLKAYGFEMYPPYSDIEKKIYTGTKI